MRQVDVFGAADAIAAGGEPPTIERIRHRIGRGSNSTIAPFLREWREQRGAQLRERGARLHAESRADLEAACLRASTAETRAERLAAENAALQAVQGELHRRLAAFEVSQRGLWDELSAVFGRALGELRELGAQGRAELRAGLEGLAAELQDGRSARAELGARLARHDDAEAARRQETALLRARCEAAERELRAERRAYRRLQRVLRRAGTLVAPLPPASA